MRPIYILACGMAAALITSGHDVITTPITFSREISRLIDSHCADCHHPGGAAFSLITYDEARPWATAIKEEVIERRMPPWGAVKGFGEFQDDRGLTQEQIELIADWVEGGAPEGDPKLAPVRPQTAVVHESPPRLESTGILVESALTLKSGMTLAGIRPHQAPGGQPVVVTATRPDGSVEPLLWLYHWQPRFARTYWYKSGLRLEPGSRIEVTPPGAAAISLIGK